MPQPFPTREELLRSLRRFRPQEWQAERQAERRRRDEEHLKRARRDTRIFVIGMSLLIIGALIAMAIILW